MEFAIQHLGPQRVNSPLKELFHSQEIHFVTDTSKVYYNPFQGPHPLDTTHNNLAFELAGPREMIYFEPAKTRIAIATCGGLCPGLNDVIRSIVMESYYNYGVKSVIGIPFGFNGLNPNKNHPIVDLTPETVANIHKDGGSMLGSSRGGTEDIGLLVDTLQRLNVNIFFALGGDGTLRGAQKISQEIEARGLKMSVIGIPKTIDNDISYIQRTFGFETAYFEAVNSIYSAHVEAKGAYNGIGLVKLMGRHSGFVAAAAALAMNDVNYVLVPEVPFDLEGPNGLLANLEKRLDRRGHAVICVAEGAGQELLIERSKETDPSGNVKLGDIGRFLQQEINAYFKNKGKEATLKYIDPSYTIRSAPANASDSVYCLLLGQFAVHAAMAGKTDLVVGQWNNVYTHVPISLAVSQRKQIHPNSWFWHSVVRATGQPFSMINESPE